MKITTIIEDNPITGVKYGTVVIPEIGKKIQHNYKRTQEKIRALQSVKLRRENTKQK